MMLARQKAMFATILVCLGVIIISAMAYVVAAERIGREHLAPDISRVFSEVLQTEISNQDDDLFTLQSMMHRMVQHYQIRELALYDDAGQRLAHSHSGEGLVRLPPIIKDIKPATDGYKYILHTGNDEYTLIIRNDVSLPGFFYIDTLTTTLMVVSISCVLVFMLYVFTRQWQQQPYEHLLGDIQEAIDRTDDERITLQVRDPDLKPLIISLNDLFWRRNQRTQHLKTANKQAEHARLRATRLSTETRQMNEDLAKEVSVRRSIEVQLKNTKTLLDGILNAMPSALFALDSRNRIVQCNQQAGEWLNKDHSQLIGLPLSQLIPELEPLALIPESPAQTPELKKEERIAITSFVRPMMSDVLAYPLPDSQQARLVIRIDDISQRQRMEEMMVQTEKMMTVGGLAAGMAHEINNPLGAILQNLQNVRRRLQDDLPANQRAAEALELDMSKVQEYLAQRGIFQFFEHIQNAGERAAGIVANMLQFSRNDHLQKRDISIAELVDTTLNIARNDLALKHIELDVSDQISQQPVHCVPSEIEQVLLNLLRNSQQALDEHDGGEHWHPRIHITVKRHHNMICILIEDNGPGIPTDIAPHIFEPFYTTKDVGEGTGLGLSVSYFIVTSHHQGKLSYHPGRLGKGACFELCLPTSQAHLPPPNPPAMLDPA